MFGSSLSLHTSGLCPSEIYVGLHQWKVQPCAAIACTAFALALGESATVAKPPSTDEVRPKVVIRGKEFFVPERYPKGASGRLDYDKKLIAHLDEKHASVLRNMCKNNPAAAQPTYKDTKADLIYKRVFCDFM